MPRGEFAEVCAIIRADMYWLLKKIMDYSSPHSEECRFCGGNGTRQYSLFGCQEPLFGDENQIIR